MIEGMEGISKDVFNEDVLDENGIRNSVKKIPKIRDILRNENDSKYQLVEFNDGTCLKKGDSKCTKINPSNIQ